MRTCIVNRLTILIVLLTLAVALPGLFYLKGGDSYEFTNLHGHVVTIYNKGIYRFDTLLKAGCFKGGDVGIILFTLPFLIFCLHYDSKHTGSSKSRLLLSSFLSNSLYHSSSAAFGASYNNIFLIYMLYFGLSLFLFIYINTTMDVSKLKINFNKVPLKGFYIFLYLSGFALFLAWLPDIIYSLTNNTTLVNIEVYTTEITYLLDMFVLINY
ncbi:hypothetical protein RCL1_006834 [Eukaryota sp. TZLM3-RCL]